MTNGDLARRMQNYPPKYAIEVEEVLYFQVIENLYQSRSASCWEYKAKYRPC